MSECMLEARQVSFGYRYDKLTLTDINLEIPCGSKVAFIGPNGAGKSTLFLHLNAILQPTGGCFAYKGEPYRYTKAHIAALRQKIGLVFQDQDSQLFAGNVLDDVVFGPGNMGMSMSEAEVRARRALDEVGMAEYMDAPVHFLSPGQKKRVALAGVLAMEPEVLVMDEPTAGLDYAGISNLSRIMDHLHKQGKTLLVATHDTDWVWAWADIVYVLNQGRVTACGPAAEILNRTDHAELGFARPVLGEIYSYLQQKQTVRPGEQPKSVTELIAFMKMADSNGGEI